MKRLLSHKHSIGWVFLAGYTFLLAYSAFHFHKIDTNTPYQFCVQESSAPSGNTNDKVLSSLFTCQFNLVYNSSFTFDFQDSALSGISDSEQFIKLNYKVKVPASRYFLISLLRAPPVLS